MESPGLYAITVTRDCVLRHCARLDYSVAVPGRCVFDLSESGRPRGLNPAGGRGKEKQKTGARGGGGRLGS